MDRLRALAIFKAVADHGGFRHAASALDLSCPVVTRTVQELETLLGVRLFQRTTRRVALTSAGHEVLVRACGVLACYDELVNTSSLCASEPSGSVRLAAPAFYGRHHLGPVLASFMARYPKVWVDLRLREGAVDPLEDEADLALCLAREFRPMLITRPVASADVGVYASSDYLVRRGEPRDPADLLAHDCLTCDGLGIGSSWPFIRRSGEERYVLNVRGALRANHAEVLVGAAVHGAGVVMLPDFLVQEALARGELQRLLPQWKAEPLSIHLAYSSRQHQALSVRKLIEHLEIALGETVDRPRRRARGTLLQPCEPVALAA
jgi:DNA-binding transcriptional LysR family regulator